MSITTIQIISADADDRRMVVFREALARTIIDFGQVALPHGFELTCENKKSGWLWESYVEGVAD